MVATITSFTLGGVNTPGIDAGTFTAPNGLASGNDILVITKMRFPVALLVGETVSTGASGYAPTQSTGSIAQGAISGTVNLGRAPAVGIFSTTESSGAWIPHTEMAPGQSYQWISVGL